MARLAASADSLAWRSSPSSRLRLRDVLEHCDGVLGLARRVALEREAQVDPDERAVLADVALLHRVTGQFSPKESGIVFKLGRQVFGLCEVLERLLDQLLARIADDLAEALVDAEQATVGILVGDADGGVLERAAEPRLALPERFLRPVAFGDVVRRPDHFDRLAGLVANDLAPRRTMRMSPSGRMTRYSQS